MPKYKPISDFGWIDFSDTDKQKVMKVIELLQPDGTVDELGVGVIRNALSESMFPGITTIMTRAKYFFIVPRILHDYLSRTPKDISAKEYLRQQENEIMQTLAEQNGYSDDFGVMGINVAKQNRNRSRHRWKELMRKPSTIYWNGLRTYKIYPGDLSIAHLLDALDKKTRYNRILGHQITEGEASDDRDAEISGMFIFSLPDYDKNWRDYFTIDLTNTEADFLKNKIIDSQPDSLIAEILKDNKAIKDFLNADSFRTMCDMPFLNRIRPENKSVVNTARDFWQIMYGAHIRYNILLHDRHGSEKVKNDCIYKWRQWVNLMKDFRWDVFDRDLMWYITKKNSVVKRFTEIFINYWMDKIQEHDYNTDELDMMVEHQEEKNKTSRSKLRHQNDEKYDKWTGISGMGFRFSNAKTIVRDIASKM